MSVQASILIVNPQEHGGGVDRGRSATSWGGRGGIASDKYAGLTISGSAAAGWVRR